MDSFQGGHFLIGFGRQLLKAFNLAVQSLLADQTGDSLIVVIARRAQCVPQFVESLRNKTNLIVDIPCPAANLFRFLVALFYHPQVGDGSQYRHKRGVRHHDDTFLVTVVEQILVVFHRLDVGWFDRQ